MPGGWLKPQSATVDDWNPTRQDVSPSTMERLIGANVSLNNMDSGKIIYVTADNLTITMPNGAAATQGMTVHIVNLQNNAAGNITVAPGSANAFYGGGLTPANNNTLKLTKASSRKGDMVTLVGQGTLGWYITYIVGTWTNA